MNGKVLWFTGLSGSGKTTIATGLAERIRNKGKTVKILDGDTIRNSVHKHLGFTPKDIFENNRLIAKLCLKYKQEYDFILVPIISPFIKCRSDARKIIGSGFIEVYIKASLEDVKKRDVKGLYKKAANGEIKNFIGVDPSVPYQPPEKPDICINTDKMFSKEDSVDFLYQLLIVEITL